MKTCIKCLIEKPETEFYKDVRSSTGRVETTCKKCRIDAQSLREKPKHPVQQTGSKYCKSCSKIKGVEKFSVNRMNLDGREKECKDCISKKKRLDRRANGIIFLPTDGNANDDVKYFTANCEVCNAEFPKIRPSHKRCSGCTRLVGDVQSHLSSTRNNKVSMVPRCSVIGAVQICKMMLASNDCCYCKRPYTDVNIKSIDHIVPIVKGGTHDTDNINICCLQCNLSKRDLMLDEWINLCKCVVENS